MYLPYNKDLSIPPKIVHITELFELVAKQLESEYHLQRSIEWAGDRRESYGKKD
jgi:hypothetical protein